MIIDLIATLVQSNQQSLFFSNNILFAYARHFPLPLPCSQQGEE